VLDLTRLPASPSLFDVERRQRRGDLTFLNSFVREVSKPVRRDGTEHIDYVPTQILCEYIRHGFADGEIAGILFRSTMSPEGTVTALFVDREDCLEPDADADLGRPQLRLVDTQEVDVEVSVSSSRARPIEFPDAPV
jgi:hypothetical protein